MSHLPWHHSPWRAAIFYWPLEFVGRCHLHLAALHCIASQPTCTWRVTEYLGDWRKPHISTHTPSQNWPHQFLPRTGGLQHQPEDIHLCTQAIPAECQDIWMEVKSSFNHSFPLFICIFGKRHSVVSLQWEFLLKKKKHFKQENNTSETELPT